MRDYTVTQLAKEIGYSRFRIYQLIAEGQIKSEKFGGMQCIPYSVAKRIIGRVENMGKYRTFKRIARQ